MSQTLEVPVADARCRVSAVSPQDAEQAVRESDLILDVREPMAVAAVALTRNSQPRIPVTHG